MRQQDTFTVERAIQQALHWHAGQVDKQGEPYILHPLRVMLAVPEPCRIVAVLHDVLEDTEASEDYFAQYLDAADLEALLLVTRRPDESYREFVQRIATASGMAGDIASEVKVADIEDNLRRMPPEDEWNDLRARYVDALRYLERRFA